MKALTLWQPWASLCVEPGPPVGLPLKQIETRSWPAPRSVIGTRIAIHAAVRPVVADEVAEISRIAAGPILTPAGWPLGAIVGTAVVEDVVPMVDAAAAPGHAPDVDVERVRPVVHLAVGERLTLCRNWAQRDVTAERPFGIYEPGRFGWLLTGARHLAEPIPCRGAQGLWTVPPDLVLEIGFRS